MFLMSCEYRPHEFVRLLTSKLSAGAIAMSVCRMPVAWAHVGRRGQLEQADNEYLVDWSLTLCTEVDPLPFAPVKLAAFAHVQVVGVVTMGSLTLYRVLPACLRQSCVR